jgi:hypothetical protein
MVKESFIMEELSKQEEDKQEEEGAHLTRPYY